MITLFILLIIRRLQDFKDCIIKLFSKLILESNDQSAVCLVTEHVGEGIFEN